MQVFLEATVVGIVTAVALWIALSLFQPQTLMEILATGFGMGMLIHFGFEFIGGNAWYCRWGAACNSLH